MQEGPIQEPESKRQCVKHLAFDIRLCLAQHEQDSWLPLIKADISSNPSKFKKILIGGPEIGPTAGKRHVHIYVEFKSQTTIPALTKHLRLQGLIWWKQQANRNDYCRIRNHHCKTTSKESPDVLLLLEHPEWITPIMEEGLISDGEKGSTTTSGTITERVRRIIENGGTVEDVKSISYGWYASHSGFVEREILKYQPIRQTVKHEHLWIYGDPQTGKTAIATVLFPNAHWQDINNPKFEGYDNQDVVILNEMDNKALRQFTVSKIKSLCDPRGTKCQINYGCVQVQAKIVVLSNYSIKNCFKYKGKNAKWQADFDETDVDYLAIKARFREVKIDKFLFEQGLQLKSKAKLRQATCEKDCFEPYDANRTDNDVYSEDNYSVRSIGTQTESITTQDEALAILHEEQELQEQLNHTKRVLNRVQELKGAYAPNFVPPVSTAPKCYDKECTIPGSWIGLIGQQFHCHQK